MIHREIHFARNLRILRSKKGLSQEKLAEAIHVTRQTLSGWERGVGKPDIFCVNNLCNYLNMPIEKLLYGNVLTEDIPLFEEEAFEQGYYLKKFDEQGLYTILDEDLEEFFGVIKYDVEHIGVLALALNKAGYTITEVFDNGFSIYLKSDEEAVEFSGYLSAVLDYFIHHDNDYIEGKRSEIRDIIGAAHETVLNNVMSEIWRVDFNSFKYYWVDKDGNPRGYANDEGECKRQAECQECREYTILERI